jgi:bacillopeptidase F (M6 metalloprotease family)
MVYGPFSLVAATDADLRFKFWLNSEPDYDGFCAMASVDGNDFYGDCWTGNSSGWVDGSLDLTDVYILGDLTGQSNVWVLLDFYGDFMVNYAEGAYVDNIVLRKCTSPSCPSGGSAEVDFIDGQIIEFKGSKTLQGE